MSSIFTCDTTSQDVVTEELANAAHLKIIEMGKEGLQRLDKGVFADNRTTTKT